MHGKLLSTNVTSRKLSGEILLYGSCIREGHPEILKKFGGVHLHVCLTEVSMDALAWKISTIIRKKKMRRVSVLTMDGSPHCVQAHYAIEDVRKFYPDLEVKHYVVEKGKIFEVGSKAVKASRHLSRLV